MDNRGSKSMMFKNIIVKEQRVDGSLLLNHYAFNSLRCALRRFERITLSGSLSDQILNKRLYSTIAMLNTKTLKILNLCFAVKEGFSLNP
jgi:hypothetical protein